jgi:hypothetical protein
VIGEAVGTVLALGWALAAWAASNAFRGVRGNLDGPEKPAVRPPEARAPRERPSRAGSP